MTQGIWVNAKRPKYKKDLKQALIDNQLISLEATSFFGNEYSGPIHEAPDGTYTIVGPDPERARNWYANIIKKGDKIIIK